MDSLYFGTAGIPLSTKRPCTTVDGVKRVRELNLDAMELEFVHSINITEQRAPEVKKAAHENNIKLTCHSPYYINLNSTNDRIYNSSLNFIIKSAKILDLCGGWSLCFHAGYYQKSDGNVTYDKIKEGVKEILKELNGIKVWIRPEISGKLVQFGNLNELIKLSQELEQVMPCIDFSHLHARSNGKYNTYGEFSSILEDIEKGLGKEALNNMHIHLSGIEYGEKGEKHHLTLDESDMNYKDLIKAFKEFKVKGVVVCESPSIEDDALLLQKIYKQV